MFPPLYLHVSGRAELVAPFAQSLPPVNTMAEARRRPKAVLGFDLAFKRGMGQKQRNTRISHVSGQSRSTAVRRPRKTTKTRSNGADTLGWADVV